jgi:hypothetical protein
VLIAWDEIVNGRRVAALRSPRRAPEGRLDLGSTVLLAPEATAMYPVLAATPDGVIAAWTTGGERATIQVRRVGPL